MLEEKKALLSGLASRAGVKILCSVDLLRSSWLAGGFGLGEACAMIPITDHWHSEPQTSSGSK